jgi:MFS family permease
VATILASCQECSCHSPTCIFGLVAEQKEVIVSSTILFAFFLGVHLRWQAQSYTFGRRPTILGAAAVFCIGALVLLLAQNYQMLVAGEILLGTGSKYKHKRARVCRPCVYCFSLSLSLFYSSDLALSLYTHIELYNTVGIESLTSPMYIAEVAKPSIRGMLVSAYNALLMCFGQFAAGMHCRWSPCSV